MVEETVLHISGKRKAAILMVSVGENIASELMGRLNIEQIEDVSREIAGLGAVDASEQDVILEEFYNLAMAHQYVEKGGLSYAQSLLEKSLPPDVANEIIKQVTQTIQKSPFHFLQKTDAENVLTFIQDDPQHHCLLELRQLLLHHHRHHRRIRLIRARLLRQLLKISVRDHYRRRHGIITDAVTSSTSPIPLINIVSVLPG